jgi:hypothetical protein
MDNLKKEVVCALAKASLTKKLEKEKLILVTAAGTIIGRVSSDMDGFKEVKTSSIWDLFEKAFSDNSKNLHPGSDGYIFLKNVELISQNHLTKYDSLLVFLDDIIACSIGTLQSIC